VQKSTDVANTTIATNIVPNLARSAKYRHYFVTILHTDCDSAYPSPNGQMSFATNSTAIHQKAT
jgi:hypothetical protein